MPARESVQRLLGKRLNLGDERQGHLPCRSEEAFKLRLGTDTGGHVQAADHSVPREGVPVSPYPQDHRRVMGINFGREAWRPTVSICQHEELLVGQLELLHDRRHTALAQTVAADTGRVSPETVEMAKDVRAVFLNFARLGEAKWNANFRDLTPP